MTMPPVSHTVMEFPVPNKLAHYFRTHPHLDFRTQESPGQILCQNKTGMNSSSAAAGCSVSTWNLKNTSGILVFDTVIEIAHGLELIALRDISSSSLQSHTVRLTTGVTPPLQHQYSVPLFPGLWWRNDNSTLREEGFILAHGFRTFSPSQWGKHVGNGLAHNGRSVWQREVHVDVA